MALQHGAHRAPQQLEVEQVERVSLRAEAQPPLLQAERKPEFAGIYSQVLQDALRRLDKAFANYFFRRVMENKQAGYRRHNKLGYPRYRTSPDRYRSFAYPQATAFRLLPSASMGKHRKIRLAGIGNVSIRYHREMEGVLKTATVKREVTTRLVNDPANAGFVFEELRITNMLKNHKLAKSISDAGWRDFLTTMAYKAARAGKPLVLVDPRNTTRECSGCGQVVPKTLEERMHRCEGDEGCGLVLGGDENAARNIKRRGEVLLRFSKGGWKK